MGDMNFRIILNEIGAIVLASHKSSVLVDYSESSRWSGDFVIDLKEKIALQYSEYSCFLIAQ